MENEDSQKILTDEILSDAKKKADRIVKRAKKEASEIVANEVAKTKEETAKIVQNAKQRAMRQESVILQSGDVEINKNKLKYLGGLFDEIIDDVRKKLSQKDAYEYRRALVTLTAQAIEQLNVKKCVVSVANDDMSRLGDTFADDVKKVLDNADVEIAVADAPAGIEAGVIVRSDDNHLEYDNSFEARLDRIISVYREQIAQIVFGTENEKSNN